MRALRRMATPVSMAAALSGCTYPFDDFLPQPTDAAPVDEVAAADSGVFQTADTSVAETVDDTFVADTGVADTFVADTAVAEAFVADTAVADIGEPDACTCIKTAGPKCKEWSPPGCGD